MSQAKLTLRPPPNIDFVQGYPGIPPGPDRQQAAVKGVIELRVGPQGVKAKWVRIELRKVETLPSGGLANTFFDFVGQSPVNVWQSSEEYSTLQSNDFPFYIRIPESIPPSIALEKGAGVKYELIATVCTKGKKGFLRRDKQNILATSSPIVIDKHELHSTWPVYAQPESRQVADDGTTLSVDRSFTCYGPGDRISISAVVKCDHLHTVILRGFEFLLRETIVFRAGPQASGKKASPQMKVNNVSEQKVPVNATLYGGTQHKAELTVTVPSYHTSTTLNAARHIDITYVLTVKALMGTGKPLVMDLPVVISNWPRAVSVEAVRRIGTAPNVASSPAHGAVPTGQSVVPSNITGRPSFGGHAHTPSGTIDISAPDPSETSKSGQGFISSTAPAGNGHALGAGYSSTTADEFGYSRARAMSIEQAAPTQVQTIGAVGPAQTSRPYTAETTTSSSTRPRSAGRGGAPPAGRFAVVNMPDEVSQGDRTQAATSRGHARQTSLGQGRSPNNPGSLSTRSQSASASAQGGWMTAEQEKRQLYERAIENVERVQGGVPRANSPPRDAGPIAQANNVTPPRGAGASWTTAEAEKARLFSEAQAAALRAQGLDGHNRNASPIAGGSPAVSAGAALYSQAMSSMSRNPSASYSATAPMSSPPPKKSFPSAEEEKAALRRYNDAKAAVDRNQYSAGGGSSEPPPPSSAPIAYDDLYPSQPPPGNPVATNGDPPPFAPYQSSSSQPSYLTEKEKLRRAYAAQDAAATQVHASPALSAVGGGYANTPPPPPAASLPPSPPQQSYTPIPNALQEKEMLRRRFEAQDAAAAPQVQAPAPAPAPAPSPPPRSGSYPYPNGSPRAALPTPRPPPAVPDAASSRPLTAAEEKARLRAMYDAEDRGGPPPASPGPYPPPTGNPPPFSLNGNGVQRQISLSAASMNGSIPPPPPLAPRPPREYIEETQEEDFRTSMRIQAIDQNGHDTSQVLSEPNLTLSPFTPFHAGFELSGLSAAASPLPPLPNRLS